MQAEKAMANIFRNAIKNKIRHLIIDYASFHFNDFFT